MEKVWMNCDKRRGRLAGRKAEGFQSLLLTGTGSNSGSSHGWVTAVNFSISAFSFSGFTGLLI